MTDTQTVIMSRRNSTVGIQGCLDFIERQSCAGHVLTIIDENQEKLSDKCSVWLNGYYYKVTHQIDTALHSNIPI